MTPYTETKNGILCELTLREFALITGEDWNPNALGKQIAPAVVLKAQNVVNKHSTLYRRLIETARSFTTDMEALKDALDN